MAKIVRLGIILFLITLITGLILGGVHSVTLKPIAEAEQKAKMSALQATLPAAKEFKQIDIKGDPGIIAEIDEGSDGGQVVGHNFTVTPKGYGGKLKVVIGIGTDGKINGIHLLDNSSETPGLGARSSEPKFTDQFKGKNASQLNVVKTPAAKDDEIQAISGATITSKGVTAGVNAAIDYWNKNLKGAGAVSRADNFERADAHFGACTSIEEGAI